MGRPPVDSEQVNLRIQRTELNGIDAYSASQDDNPKRPEAIRRILSDWLQKNGYVSKAKR